MRIANSLQYLFIQENINLYFITLNIYILNKAMVILSYIFLVTVFKHTESCFSTVIKMDNNKKYLAHFIVEVTHLGKLNKLLKHIIFLKTECP